MNKLARNLERKHQQFFFFSWRYNADALKNKAYLVDLRNLSLKTAEEKAKKPQDATLNDWCGWVPLEKKWQWHYNKRISWKVIHIISIRFPDSLLDFILLYESLPYSGRKTEGLFFGEILWRLWLRENQIKFEDRCPKWKQRAKLKIHTLKFECPSPLHIHT